MWKVIKEFEHNGHKFKPQTLGNNPFDGKYTIVDEEGNAYSIDNMSELVGYNFADCIAIDNQIRRATKGDTYYRLGVYDDGIVKYPKVEQRIDNRDEISNKDWEGYNYFRTREEAIEDMRETLESIIELL